MIKRNTLVAGVAALAVAVGATAAFAQADMNSNMGAARPWHKKQASRPLTVRRAVAPNPAVGVGEAVAAPVVAAGAIAGGAVGATAGIVGGTVAGATGIAAAPFAGLAGYPPSISPNPAPPLPIRARYANSGPVTATFDEGFSQDVPVDRSGPIYKIDNTGHDRSVTPFSLAMFPVTAATYAVTAPLRPVAPHP